MNLEPKIWGPHAWFIMYSMAFSYPTNASHNKRNSIKQFYLSFGENLPCAKCKHNFNTHLQKFPLDNNVLNSRVNLIQWVVNIENEVRKTVNKKPVHIDDIINKYQSIYSNEQPKSNKIYTYCIIVTIILLIMYLYVKMRLI